MKHLSAALIALPLLFAAPLAHADTVTRVVTTTTTNNCRDFTKTTNYVDRTVTSQGTACLYADGAWHDITSPGNPIIQYETPVVVQRPVVYTEPAVVPVVYPRVIYRPVYRPYYGYDRYDHPHHYDNGFGWDIHGRF